MRRGAVFYSVGAFVIFSSNCLLAQDLATQREALREIREAAADLCVSVPLETASETMNVSGEVNAKLVGLAKRVADLGIEGAAEYTSTASAGLLQNDLADAVRETNNCKLEVFRVLEQKMLLSASPSRGNGYLEAPLDEKTLRRQEKGADSFGSRGLGWIYLGRYLPDERWENPRDPNLSSYRPEDLRGVSIDVDRDVNIRVAPFVFLGMNGSTCRFSETEVTGSLPSGSSVRIEEVVRLPECASYVWAKISSAD